MKHRRFHRAVLTALLVLPVAVMGGEAGATPPDCPSFFASKMFEIVVADEASVSSSKSRSDPGQQVFYLGVDEGLATDFACAAAAGCTTRVDYTVSGVAMPAASGQVASVEGTTRLFTSFYHVETREQSYPMVWPDTNASINKVYREKLATSDLRNGHYIQLHASQTATVQIPRRPRRQPNAIARLEVSNGGRPVLHFSCGVS